MKAHMKKESQLEIPVNASKEQNGTEFQEFNSHILSLGSRP